MTPAQQPQELASPSDIQVDDTVRITYDLGEGFIIKLEGRVKTINNNYSAYISFHAAHNLILNYTLFQVYNSRTILLLDRPKKLTPITLDQLLTLPFDTEVHGVSGSAPFQGTVSGRYQNCEGYLELVLKGTNGHQGICIRGYPESLNFDPKTLRAKI